MCTTTSGARDLFLASGAEAAPVFRFRTGPVCDTVNGAPVTERGVRELFFLHETLRFPLHVEDRALRNRTSGDRLVSREPATEQDRRSLGHDGDMLAVHRSSCGEHGGLASARTAGQHDQ